MSTLPTQTRRGGSPALAFILITIGGIWLLGQLGVLTAANFAVLFQLWPLLLIAIGVQLLVGHTSRALSTLLIVGTLILLLVLMLIGPAIGLTQSYEVQTAQFSAPRADLRAATLNLSLGIGDATVRAVPDSVDLVSIDAAYIGDYDFQSEIEGDAAQVWLRYSGNNLGTFNFGFLGIQQPGDDLYTTVGLATGIPLDLTVNTSVGSGDLDLTGLTLTRLELNSGVSETTLILPVVQGIDIVINSGVSTTRMSAPDGASFEADINGGVGQIDLDLPNDAPLQVRVRGGLNDLRLPASLTRVSGNDNDGTWETADFASADGGRIIITYEGGIGQFTIR